MLLNRTAAIRHALLGATSLTLALITPSIASAEIQVRAPSASLQTDDSAYIEPSIGSEDDPGIIIRNDLNPNAPPPAGNLDSGITGVGQMTVRPNPGTAGLSLCTGTLINPRTVIFAAHCVNTRPADAYGPNGIPFGLHSGGTPIAFGFNADNRPAVRQWLGLDGGTAGATNIANALYAVEQVWWDPRSLNPGSNGFLTADIAIATLDTPAFGIPTWAMLFSPLDGPVNALQIGYGNRGNDNSTSIAIDFRRRTAENMISLLGSLNDRNRWLFGSGSVVNNVYMLSFSDPNPAFNPAAGKFDFGVFGGPSRGDVARAREGTTAGGDSGGPLVVEDKYDRQVVAGVLSGGSRFFTAQQGHNYGTHSFYQPLHTYWETIVANNPYVYAGNRGGNGNWEDAAHWIQLMDPNYMIDVNGRLVNGLPNTPEEGVSGTGAKWGYICRSNGACTQLNQAAAAGSGDYIVVPGGPGSTNFVPNNISANPAAGVRARYYDVTLSAAGTTSLGSSVTIDRMTLDGQTRLNVAKGGSLSVLGEYNQIQGWSHVDGRIQSGRDMMLLSGMLSGTGTVKAPFLTVVGAIVAPGAGTIGTLTVDGNMVLASASSLFIDVNRSGSDKLLVTGGLSLAGSLMMNNVGREAVRHGQTYSIINAAQGLTGTFNNIYSSFQGVLQPRLTYGANDVTATILAGSLVTHLGASNATEMAFARALDQLRGSSYTQLYGLYGAIDMMAPGHLAMTLNSMTPRIAGETRALQDRQSTVMLSAVTDRLSSLGTRSMPSGLSVVGSPTSLATMNSAHGASQQTYASLLPATVAAGNLPRGVTGFISGGAVSGSAGYGQNRSNVQGQLASHVGMGLETELAEGLILGTAFGHSRGYSAPGADRTESKMSQMAVYGSYRLDGGAYVGGAASAETSTASLQRQVTTGYAAFNLHGAATSSRYNLVAEAGVNLAVARGMTLTPRAQVAYGSYRLDGFRESGAEFALQMDSLRLDQLQARMGAKLAGSTSIGKGWTMTPQLQADYVHMIAGSDAGMKVRFANAGDHTFALPLAGGDTGWAEARGGLKLVNGKIEFGAGLETTVGRSEVRDDRAVADFTLRF